MIKCYRHVTAKNGQLSIITIDISSVRNTSGGLLWHMKKCAEEPTITVPEHIKYIWDETYLVSVIGHINCRRIDSPR